MREFDVQLTVYDYLLELMYNGMYLYSIFIMASYLILAMLSFRSVRQYIHKNFYVDYNDILNTPIAPGVTLLAPAYNEAATIIDNIRSLLSIHYSKFEVIVINDGSKDDTLQKAIEAFDMEKVNFAVNNQIDTKEVKGVYKSKNKAYAKLILVDKANGGKSDALNVGMNVSSYEYVTCIDVDCVLEQDALLKMMKPFTDQVDVEVIATGGVIRIANSCKVEDGRLLEVKVPDNFVARSQTLEYIRAFLLGRMAWSLLDGLILISGALGVFNKKIAIEVGGYDHSTVGEDMELVVRMRKHMLKQKREYEVAFIPDPLCWTECPETWSILGRQRNRWTRGTIETLIKHRDMFLNPYYKKIGLLSYPYWFFFEWLAPLMESFGIMLFLLMAMIGAVNWSFFFLMLFLVYGFTLCFSVLSLLIEEVTYHQYKKKSDILRLLKVGILEPLWFHPFLVYSAIMGNFDYITGNKSWGDMQRKGFQGRGRSGGFSFFQVVRNFFLKARPGALFQKFGAIGFGLLIVFIIIRNSPVWPWMYEAFHGIDYFERTENIHAIEKRNAEKNNLEASFGLFDDDEKGQERKKAHKNDIVRPDDQILKDVERREQQEAEIQAKKDAHNKEINDTSHKEIPDEKLDRVVHQKKVDVNSKKKENKAHEHSKKIEPIKTEPLKKSPKIEPTKKKESKPIKVEKEEPNDLDNSTEISGVIYPIPNVYYLVAGTYNTIDKAKEFQSELQQNGFGALVVKAPTNYKVVYDKFDEMKRAKDYMLNIKTNVNKNVWIYKVKE